MVFISKSIHPDKIVKKFTEEINSNAVIFTSEFAKKSRVRIQTLYALLTKTTSF
ncbi:hypothetical protein EV682_102210 [Iodobacter fluviatilis]|uniref:Uncharacterized protein n=2 Tax=Iodobacter fluviatilis TaxID=537 RepID=A0A377Q7H0_9NEIS|nr:hypothetical protein EV682_102210 [Iodobacter fluviatilis]STQ90668.1 Uncharacterised protein [Iodobacter fluviatilis]